MRNNAATGARKMTAVIARQAMLVFIVFGAAALAGGALAKVIALGTGSETPRRIGVGVAACMLAIAMLGWAVNGLAEITVTLAKVRAYKLTLRLGISAFIGRALLTIFALFVAYTAASWGVKCLIGNR